MKNKTLKIALLLTALHSTSFALIKFDNEFHSIAPNNSDSFEIIGPMQKHRYHIRFVIVSALKPKTIKSKVDSSKFVKIKVKSNKSHFLTNKNSKIFYDESTGVVAGEIAITSRESLSTFLNIHFRFTNTSGKVLKVKILESWSYQKHLSSLYPINQAEISKILQNKTAEQKNDIQ